MFFWIETIKVTYYLSLLISVSISTPNMEPNNHFAKEIFHKRGDIDNVAHAHQN